MARRHHSRSRKQRATRRKQRGGYGAASVPVGYAWTADAATWPGVIAANGGDTQGAAMANYLPLSPYGIAVGGVDIAVPEIMFKGGRRKSRKHKKRGGKRMSRGGQNVNWAGAFGGSRRKTHRKRRHFGGFGPQELINFGRDLKFRAMGAYDSFMGNQAPVNPSPLDQPINENYKVVEPTPINLPRAFSLAGDSVAPL